MPDTGSDSAASYKDARDRFIDAAARCGASLRQYSHPSATDPAGEPLFVDVAMLGDVEASTALLMLSGTHGLEGPAGSAIQRTWMQHIAGAALPTGIKVVLVHALNPWGFAHGSRTTENNVDLNRNFLDFGQELPVNPDYGKLHDTICPATMDESTRVRIRASLEAFESQYGYRRLNDALGAGQYTFPTGMSFGGAGPEWSNRVLHEILATALAGTIRLGVIDWHTGRGSFGLPFFLCFSKVGSEAFDRAASWWGHDALTEKDHIGEAYEGLEPPPRHGLLFKGIERAMAPAEVVGAVVEIGTYEPRRVVAAEMIDRWLKFETDPDDPAFDRHRREVAEAFFPQSPTWRGLMLQNAMPVIDAALAGLAEWERSGGEATESRPASGG